MPLARDSKPPNPHVLGLLVALRARGWSQVAIAEQIGVGQTAVSQMERGLIQVPNYEVMDRLRALVKSKKRPEKAEA